MFCREEEEEKGMRHVGTLVCNQVVVAVKE